MKTVVANTVEWVVVSWVSMDMMTYSCDEIDPTCTGDWGVKRSRGAHHPPLLSMFNNKVGTVVRWVNQVMTHWSWCGNGGGSDWGRCSDWSNDGCWFDCVDRAATSSLRVSGSWGTEHLGSNSMDGDNEGGGITRINAAQTFGGF